MAGGVVSKDELKQWRHDRYSVEFTDKADAVHGLSSYLVRGRPGNRSTVAVGGDARPETAINALLDLLAWQWQLTVKGQKPAAEAADLLVGDGPYASHVLEALRTLVATHAGRPRIHLHLAAKAGTTRTFLHVTAAGYGVLVSAAGGGALLGVIAGPVLFGRLPLRWRIGGAIAAGAPAVRAAPVGTGPARRGLPARPGHLRLGAVLRLRPHHDATARAR